MSYLSQLSGLLILLIVAGCMVSKTICPCEAPEVIRLGEKEIEISAQISMTDTTALSGMSVKIWLSTLDHTTLPTNFKADYYYLRSSNLARAAFEGKFTRTNTDLAKGIMELEANNVPRWDQSELVDIAVHLIDSRGKIHFLKKDTLSIQPVNRF